MVVYFDFIRLIKIHTSQKIKESVRERMILRN